MKAITLKKNSWHYWLATNVADYKEYHNDFCAYVRSVFLGLIFFCFFTCVFGVMGFGTLYAIGRTLYSLYTCKIAGWFGIVTACTYGNFEEVTLSFMVGIASILGLIALGIWRYTYKDKIQKEIYAGLRKAPEPSFIALAYQSLKGKTCFRVQFQEKKKANK